MTAVDEAWHELLYSLYACSLAWHPHRLVKEKRKQLQQWWNKPGGVGRSSQTGSCGVCYRRTTATQKGSRCAMAAAATAAAPSLAAGSKARKMCASRSVLGSTQAEERHLLIQVSATSRAAVPLLLLGKYNTLSIVFLNIYLK